MPDPVIVFSVDKLRRGITKKILEREGFQVILLTKILGMREKIAGQAQGVVIFDVYRCFPDEIRHLKNLCRVMEMKVVILLGDPTITEGFPGPWVSRDLCLPDPLDPDLIIKKIKEASMPDEEARVPKTDTLEGELLRFLRLH